MNDTVMWSVLMTMYLICARCPALSIDTQRMAEDIYTTIAKMGGENALSQIRTWFNIDNEIHSRHSHHWLLCLL